MVLQPTLRPSEQTDDLVGMFSDKPMAQRSLREKPTRNYQGLPLEGWMLYPSLFLGGVYDDNIFTTSVGRIKSAGMQFKPAVIAERSSGVQHSAVFLNADFTMYPGHSKANVLNSQAGVGHVWEAERDLVIKLGAEYDILTNPFTNGLLSTPYGYAVINGEQRSDAFGGFVSAVKSFDKFFIGLSIGATATAYNALDTSVGALPQSYRDNLLTTGTGRLGYSFSPVIYAFAEVSGNIRDYSSDTVYGLLGPGISTPGTFYNSQGYRALIGLGSERISLFKGEIYAGYQLQDYTAAVFGSHSSVVYGGKVTWYPTRAWTVSLLLDETFQDSALPLYGNPLGSSAFVTQATAAIQYTLSRQWNASLTGGYAIVNYLSGGRRDARWTAGGTLNYEISRNIYATASYALIAIDSNVAGGSLTRNHFAMGATYKY
jgi:hypothetical protein